MPRVKTNKSTKSVLNNRHSTNRIEVAMINGVSLDEGQKVLVCKTIPGEIVSQITGKRMGSRERVIASGVVSNYDGKTYILTEKPVKITEKIEVKRKPKRQIPFRNPHRRKSPKFYVKTVEE